MLFSLAVLATLAQSFAASALVEEPTSHLTRRQAQISSFPGINFKYAINECTADQLDALSSAVQGTQDLLSYTFSASRKSYAWRNFFLYVNENGANTRANSWAQDGYTLRLSQNIWNSFTQAAQWASKGHKSGIATEARQISFRCKEDPAVKLACTAASGRGPAAYTTHPGASEGGGWQITFCPTFFITKTLNDLTNGYHYRDINNLMSQEHVLAHEYMHVDKIGHAHHIEDTVYNMASCTGSCNVYGAWLSHEWAWFSVDKGDDPTSTLTYAKINKLVPLNADNYAWFATAHWFNGHWEGRTFSGIDKKRRSVLMAHDVRAKRQVADETGTADPATQTAGLDILPETADNFDAGVVYTDGEEVQETLGNEPDFPLPANCAVPDDSDAFASCAYLGEEYTSWVADPSGTAGPTPTGSVTVGAPITSITDVSTPVAAPPATSCVLTSTSTTDTFCQCGNTIAGINTAVTAGLTTTYCAITGSWSAPGLPIETSKPTIVFGGGA